MPSDPPGHVGLAIPKSVLWSWTTIAVTTIGLLVRLAFGLEADLVSAQKDLGSMSADLHEIRDRVFSYEAQIDVLRTRVAVLESQQRTR